MSCIQRLFLSFFYPLENIAREDHGEPFFLKYRIYSTPNIQPLVRFS